MTQKNVIEAEKTHNYIETCKYTSCSVEYETKELLVNHFTAHSNSLMIFCAVLYRSSILFNFDKYKCRGKCWELTVARVHNIIFLVVMENVSTFDYFFATKVSYVMNKKIVLVIIK